MLKMSQFSILYKNYFFLNLNNIYSFLEHDLKCWHWKVGVSSEGNFQEKYFTLKK